MALHGLCLHPIPKHHKITLRLSYQLGYGTAGRPSVAKAWRDTFAAQNVQAFLYPGSAVTVQ